jgi:hypothetical protein
MLEFFKVNAAKKIEDIKDFVVSNYSLKADEFKQVNTALFQILYSLIDPSLSAIREAGASALFGDGLGLLKRISDKFGPGVGAKQTETKVKIMHETQSAEETAEEFADRLEQLNASLEAPIEDTMLVQFLINGISDNDLKKFLIDAQKELQGLIISLKNMLKIMFLALIVKALAIRDDEKIIDPHTDMYIFPSLTQSKNCFIYFAFNHIEHGVRKNGTNKLIKPTWCSW